MSVIITSSAYDVCVCGGGSGISCIYRLKSVGDIMEPCGTPMMISVCDGLPL